MNDIAKSGLRTAKYVVTGFLAINLIWGGVKLLTYSLSEDGLRMAQEDKKEYRNNMRKGLMPIESILPDLYIKSVVNKEEAKKNSSIPGNPSPEQYKN